MFYLIYFFVFFFFFTFSNVATGKFKMTYVPHKYGSWSISIGQLWSRAEVTKLWPSGQMWPTTWFCTVYKPRRIE